MKQSERLRGAGDALDRVQDPTDYIKAVILYAYELGKTDGQLGLPQEQIQKTLSLLADTADKRYIDCLEKQSQEALKFIAAFMGIEHDLNSEPPKKPDLVLIPGGSE